MLLQLLLDLGVPVITDASVLKKKNKYMTNAENNTLIQKQQRNNKDLGHPTIVDTFGCYTTETL